MRHAISQTDALQEAVGPITIMCRTACLVPIGEGGNQDVFQHRALRQEIMGLENKSDLPVANGGEGQIVQSVQILSIENDHSAAWAIECPDDLKQGALSR